MSLSPTSDIVGASKKSGGLIGLLLVAVPVLLIGWMIIYPIIAVVITTL